MVYSYIILVAMATPLARSKIQVAYLNSTTPYLHAKNSRFLVRIEICAILAYFCPNLVVMATPLKIQVTHSRCP